MIVGISRAALDQILDHADRSPREEVCGLLLGRNGYVESVQCAGNVASNRSTAFEVDPQILIAAHRSARSGGPIVIGHYHSHPYGDATPSIADAANADPGMLWMILARGEARLFVARQDGTLHGCFDPVEFELR